MLVQARPALLLRWILISYFLIGGGVAIAFGALGFAWYSAGTFDAAALAELVKIAEEGIPRDQSIRLPVQNIEIATALAYACGAAFGGFFAGRASPHKSYIEPAIAAALVVGSFVLAVYMTPMGKLLISLTGDHLERMVSILCGVGIAFGLIGAILGELAETQTAPGFVRQAALSVIISAGALWTSLIIFGLVFANEVAEQALKNYWNPNSQAIVEVSMRRVAAFAGVAVAVASGAAGVAGQLASRGNSVGPVTFAAFAVFAGAGATTAVIPGISSDLAPQLAFGGAAIAAVLAAAAAYLTWFVLPKAKR